MDNVCMDDTERTYWREAGPKTAASGAPAMRRIQRPVKPRPGFAALQEALASNVWDKTEAQLLADLLAV
jgi:hypothetical protein